MTTSQDSEEKNEKGKKKQGPDCNKWSGQTLYSVNLTSQNKLLYNKLNRYSYWKAPLFVTSLL